MCLNMFLLIIFAKWSNTLVLADPIFYEYKFPV